MENKFYCSQKFCDLSVNLEKLQMASCCAAAPSRINLQWLSDNPGQIFNTPDWIKEREQMLSGVPVDSCSTTCWQVENRGMTSRRLLLNSQHITNTDLILSPTRLDILIGSDCNLTCSYCCKQYSSAWSRDVHKNGSYGLDTEDDRYVINDKDLILMKISQKELSNFRPKQILFNELETLCHDLDLNEIIISGGEPFLYLELSDLIKKISSKITIEIYSGLGVDPVRFRKEIAKILDCNFEVTVSAENIGTFYEFNRYGNTWQRFNENLKCLDEHQVKYRFRSTLSNLTLFGLIDFIEFVGDRRFTYQLCTEPDFLALNLIDPQSKEVLLDLFEKKLSKDLSDIIASNMLLSVDARHKRNLKKFLQEFSSRRNIDLGIFPKTFIGWLDDV